MSLNIRKATKDDLPTIFELYTAFEAEDAPMFDLEKTARIFTRTESYPNYAIYLAEMDGEIIGTFALLIMDNLAHLGAPEGIIENVAIHPQMQGRRVGKTMMKQAMEICTEASCYKLVLSSSIKRERAHQFYESLGFEKYGYSFRVKTEH
jgi:N-acetylglutamate synthase-like GNAT family acetyltransferase